MVVLVFVILYRYIRYFYCVVHPLSPCPVVSTGAFRLKNGEHGWD